MSPSRAKQGLRSVPRAAWAWGLLLLLCAGVLCRIPLFQVPGFESSLALAIAISWAGLWVGVTCAHRARQEVVSAPSGGVDGEFRRWTLRALLYTELMLVVPLGMLWINGWHLNNCNNQKGLPFFFFMPMCSAVCAVATGVVAGLWTPRKWLGLLLALGSFVAVSLIWTLFRYLVEPAVFFYDPFFGYFPGAIYDENISIHRAFFWARCMHALGVTTVLLGAAVLLDPSSLVLRMGRLVRPTRWRGAFCISLVLWLGLFVAGKWLGTRGDVRVLRATLSATRETAHVVLRYQPAGSIAKDIDQWARECEFRYHQLQTLWQQDAQPLTHGWARAVAWWRGVGASSKITLYLFEDATTSQQLVGIGSTLVTKPWTREVFLLGLGWDHTTLKHELAHAFWGDLALNPGLLEGVAVASEGSSGEFSPVQKVNMMHREHLTPPLQQVFGLSFWTLPGPRAYILAGTFLRYGLERFGLEPTKRIVLSGGKSEDFARIYRVPFSQLEQDFYAWVGAQPMPPDSKKEVPLAFTAKDIFHKVCAHDIADRRQQAWGLVYQHRTDEALRLFDSICRDDPHNSAYAWDRIEFLWRIGRFADVQNSLEQFLKRTDVVLASQREAWARLGDVAAVRGQGTQALAHYQQALALCAVGSGRRLLVAKAYAAAHQQAALLDVLVDSAYTEKGQYLPRRGVRDTWLLTQACNQASPTGLCAYWLGRRLWQEESYAEAQHLMERALTLGLPDEEMTKDASFLYAKSAFFQGDWAAAERTLLRLLAQLPPYAQGKRLLWEEWLERVRWSASQKR